MMSESGAQYLCRTRRGLRWGGRAQGDGGRVGTLQPPAVHRQDGTHVSGHFMMLCSLFCEQLFSWVRITNVRYASRPVLSSVCLLPVLAARPNIGSDGIQVCAVWRVCRCSFKRLALMLYQAIDTLIQAGKTRGKWFSYIWQVLCLQEKRWTPTCNCFCWLKGK